MTAGRRMLHRLRDERGFSLMEVLIAAALMTVVLGTALLPFQLVQRTQRVAENQNDAQDNVRNAVQSLAHQLRNVMGQTQLVDRAGPYDLVFETVDPNPKPVGSNNSRNLMRVRYCLDATNPARGVIRRQELRWTTTTAPSTLPGTSCPDTGFGNQSVVANRITNQYNGQDRPLFVYFPSASPLVSITGVRFDIYSDRSVTEAPTETRLTSSVFLRNQNGAPTATASITPTGPPRQVALNAGGSADPENLPLTYRWCDLTTNSTCDAVTAVGTGQLFTYTLPGTGARSMVLVVFDAGGLEADYTFTANTP
jgi:prepilin-type N-terminal cleavage/methylation domain-containing protein